MDQTIERPSANDGRDPDMHDVRALLAAVWARRWRIALGGLVGVALALAAISLMDTRYAAVAKVMLDPRERQVVTSEAVVSNLPLSEEVIESEAAVIRSNILLGDVVARLSLQELAAFDPAGGPGSAVAATGGVVGDIAPDVLTNLRERSVKGLSDALYVQQDGVSYVISIRVDAPAPDLAAKTANTIAQRYVARQSEQRQATTRLANDALRERVQELREEVEAAEARVEQMKGKRAASGGAGIEAMTEQLSEIARLIASVRAENAGTQARHDQATALIERAGFDAAAATLESPLVVALRQNRTELTRKRADLSSRYGKAHPERLKLEAELARLDEDIAQAVSKIVEGYRNEVDIGEIRAAALARDLGELERDVIATSSATIDMREAEREAEAARAAFRSALTRLKETELQETLPQADATVIARAVPPSGPSSPKSALLTGLGGIAGATLAFATILFARIGRPLVEDAIALEARTNLPVLARMKGDARGVADALLVGFASMRDGRGLRSIALTSNASGSAKRSRRKLASALGVAVSERGRPVLHLAEARRDAIPFSTLEDLLDGRVELEAIATESAGVRRIVLDAEQVRTLARAGPARIASFVDRTVAQGWFVLADLTIEPRDTLPNHVIQSFGGAVHIVQSDRDSLEEIDDVAATFERSGRRLLGFVLRERTGRFASLARD